MLRDCAKKFPRTPQNSLNKIQIRHRKKFNKKRHFRAAKKLSWHIVSVGSTFNGAIAKYLHVKAIKLSQRKRVLLGMWEMYGEIHHSLKKNF